MTTAARGRRRSFQHLALVRDAREEGAFAVGKHRVLLEQRIALCGDKHARAFRLADVPDAPIVCGVCHPPAATLAVEWL